MAFSIRVPEPHLVAIQQLFHRGTTWLSLRFAPSLPRHGPIMKHVRSTIEELRRYISTCEAHNELQEVDTLLALALEEIRRKLTAAQRKEPPSLRE
jgi:hypothetical protein